MDEDDVGVVVVVVKVIVCCVVVWDLCGRLVKFFYFLGFMLCDVVCFVVFVVFSFVMFWECVYYVEICIVF